jgi:hypothetical protein
VLTLRLDISMYATWRAALGDIDNTLRWPRNVSKAKLITGCAASIDVTIAFWWVLGTKDSGSRPCRNQLNIRPLEASYTQVVRPIGPGPVQGLLRTSENGACFRIMPTRPPFPLATRNKRVSGRVRKANDPCWFFVPGDCFFMCFPARVIQHFKTVLFPNGGAFDVQGARSWGGRNDR